MAAVMAEKVAEQNRIEKETRKSLREDCLHKELPLYQILKAKGYINDNSKMTKNVLIKMLSRNNNIQTNLKINNSSSRTHIVDLLLDAVASNELSIK